MAPPFKYVAIIGASGNIGSIILHALLESAQFNITAISRSTSTATFPFPVTILGVDFSSDDALTGAFRGQDVIISAVGATGFGDQKRFVDAAVRAGVQRFIPSEFSASSQNETVVKLLPLFALKADLIDYLRSKESEGLTWTGIASSGLLDWSLKTGFFEFDLTNRTAVVWDDGNKRASFTNEKQLGEAVVSVLQHPVETSNQYLYIASVETTQNEILAALKEASGKSWTVTYTTTDEQIAEGVRKLQAGDFSGAFNLVRSLAFGNTPGLKSNYVKDEKLANDLLGLSLEDVKDVAKRVLKK